MSDIILVLTDIRHPVFHFPPALYDYVVHTLKKPMILVLNKTDLIPHEIVTEWLEYFRTRYPELKVVPFSCYPREDEALSLENLDIGSKVKRRRRTYGKAFGVRDLLLACNIP